MFFWGSSQLRKALRTLRYREDSQKAVEWHAGELEKLFDAEEYEKLGDLRREFHAALDAAKATFEQAGGEGD